MIREAQPTDATNIATVHIESWRTTYAQLLPAEFLANLSIDQRTGYWRNIISKSDNPTFVYVAENEAGQIIGFASGGPERTEHPDYNGELYAIYLLKKAQGQGVGRQLVKAVAERLLQQDFTSMLVWVLADNPSRKFYEALGGQAVAEKDIIVGGNTIPEVGYGWLDLSNLVATL